MKGAISPTGRTKEVSAYILHTIQKGLAHIEVFPFHVPLFIQHKYRRSADVFNVFPSPFDNRLLLYVVRSKATIIFIF